MLEYDEIDVSGGIDVRQILQKNTIFVIIGIFQINILSVNHISVMVLMMQKV